MADSANNYAKVMDMLSKWKLIKMEGKWFWKSAGELEREKN